MLRKLLFLSLLISFNASANEEVKRIAHGFHRTNTQKDSSLKKDQSIYHFHIRMIDDITKSSRVSYSIDGISEKVKLEDGQFEVKTTPGKHIFQLYINYNYYELYSDSLEIKSGYKDSYNVYPMYAEQIEVISDKPVIYLYPKEKTTVKVKVEEAGQLTFTYPRYSNGWKVEAHPDGDIIFNDQVYNYLFWEGKKKMHLKGFDQKEGFIVQGSDIATFLETKLDEAKFTSKEKADFITYWAPRMMGYDKMFVHFYQNEECNQFAKLDVTPNPDSIQRFYITWMPIQHDIKIQAQTITPINRKGFTLVEWGGQQITK